MRSQFAGWAFSFLAAACGATASWKMLQFHGRLKSIENPQWERQLAAEDLYRHPVVMFGDSEIAMWPMATSFGILPIINRGVVGDEVLKSRGRFEAEALPLNPAVVVILIGTNDLAHGRQPAEIRARIAEMVALSRRRGATVVLCSVLPARGAAAGVRPLRTVRSMNEALRQLAQEEAATYVDLYSAVIERDVFAKRFSDDGLHPNAAGYLRMTKTLLPVLLRSLPPAG